jgi:hypothetical protein
VHPTPLPAAARRVELNAQQPGAGGPGALQRCALGFMRGGELLVSNAGVFFPESLHWVLSWLVGALGAGCQAALPALAPPRL